MKLKKLLSATIAGVISISMMAVNASAYFGSDTWNLRYSDGVPATANCLVDKATFTADGHKNIYIDCTQFDAETSGVIVYYSGSYTDDAGNVFSNGVSGRYTTESSSEVHGQTNIAPFGTKITITFSLDYNDYSGSMIYYGGNCHTNS